MGKNKKRQKILIVDDSEMNRTILSEMLGDEYDIIEAADGMEAITVLQRDLVDISLMLLDIVMPKMDGYEVLSVMNSRQWIKDVPVIMISSESSPASIHRTYELGVTDFISRPFDAVIVRRRVVNTIRLYTKYKSVAELAADQIYEKEKNNNLMISILSHIVEFRNGESGLHILHVKSYTDILLNTLVRISDKYKLSNFEITTIRNASALHDIGKISVPDEILNKPGRLTREEFEIMKKHSMAGAEMLSDLGYTDEPLVKTAYEICRWHHERYDGRGYPDGLKGDEIPISAQVVALADVYDALTSERVYKKAYSHEKAVDMIMNGACGTFNPVLLQCLEEASDTIRNVKDSPAEERNEVQSAAAQVHMYDELSSSEHILYMLEHERIKNKFFSSLAEDILFEYTVDPPMVTLNPGSAEKLGIPECIMDPLSNESLLAVIPEDDLKNISGLLREATPDDPEVTYECDIRTKDGMRRVSTTMRTLWSMYENVEYTGAIGKSVDTGPTKEIEISVMKGAG